MSKSILGPRGIAVWPKINRPDTKFNPDGLYSLSHKLEGKAAASFKKQIDEILKEAVTKAKTENKKHAKTMKVNLPYKPETDDEGNETGALLFNFKRKAKGENKKTGESWKNTIKLFDAKGKPTKALVGGGSTVVPSFRTYPYFTAQIGAGIVMELLAVQVIDLVQGGTAESYGFEAQEDGFEDDGTAAVASDDDDTKTTDPVDDDATDNSDDDKDLDDGELAF